MHLHETVKVDALAPISLDRGEIPASRFSPSTGGSASV
jgi:hypothetical protein